MKIVNKTSVGQRRVYDIEVEDVHNFYANGINVHNCATDGGVSVIKDDGTVVDITGQTQAISHVSFNSDEELITTGNFQDQYFVYSLPPSDIAYNNGTYLKRFYTFVSTPALMGGVAKDLINAHVASNEGLTRFAENPTTPSEGMVAYTTSTYNTGWMPGDIKLAALSDTDDTDLVASEVVTNGTFDIDATGWSATGGAGLSTVDGKLKINNDVANFGGTTQTIATVPGRAYVLTAEIEISNTAVTFRARNEPNLAVLSTQIVSATGAYELHFVAISTATQVQIINADGTLGDFSLADNISVRPADADRSANNRGLLINGSVTRTPVATGADLVAYSGFSSSNYLEMPYNSDLDFGTGDFCVMGWVKPVSSTDDYIFDCRQSTISPTGFFIYINGGSYPTFYTQQAGSSTVAVSSTILSLGVWQHVVGLRKSGVNYLYLNGVLVGSASGATQNVNDTGRKLIVGNSVGLFSYHALQSSLALLRISATAPTADQILKIYNDEKVLFQDNAQATLYGASDAVTGLAYDEDTDLLHVGTSAGRSIFNGLRRINNTTTGVTTAISANNGVIAEQ